MAAYNSEKYIAQSIESVLNQTYGNFELIIINDDSSDRTPQIVEEYGKRDSRVKLINSEENLFVIKARNLGISQAKGKYIAILDSDDLALPERFEKEVNCLETRPDVFLVGGSTDFIDENNNFIREQIAPTDFEEIKRQISGHNIIQHSSVMFRNDGIFYREKMFYTEDYDLFLNLIAENKKIINLPEKLFKYRYLADSLSRRGTNFIYFLFKQKAQEFYRQKIRTGRDEYEDFNPQDFFQMTDLEYISKEKDLYLGLKSTWMFGDYKNFNLLMKKVKKQKIKGKDFLIFKMINLFGKSSFDFSFWLYLKRYKH